MLLLLRSNGPPAYTLTAAAGAFTLTGVAAGLKAGRGVTASVGAFTLTGVAAGLKAARVITGGIGAFVLTGKDASLTTISGFVLTAAKGTFVHTGVAATVRHDARITGVSQSYALTGKDAMIFAGSVPLFANPAAFILTGNDAALIKGSIHTNPVIMMSFSDDGGITWSTESSAAIGRNGDYKRKIKFRRLGVTGRRGRTFRFRASAAVMRGFLGCAIDVEKLNTAGTQPQPGMR